MWVAPHKGEGRAVGFPHPRPRSCDFEGEGYRNFLLFTAHYATMITTTGFQAGSIDYVSHDKCSAVIG